MLISVISGLPDLRRDFRGYSSSLLAERNVSFVRQQSKFVHDVIRLAKLWNDKVTWNGPQRISRRSVAIELVAISAANEEEKAHAFSACARISVAFKTFLNKFIGFDRNMNVFFPFQVNQSEQDGEPLIPVYDGYQKLIDKEYQKQITKRPVILDVVNSYNNLAEEFSEEVKKAFEVHARNTLAAINNFRSYGDGPKVDIEQFFAV